MGAEHNHGVSKSAANRRPLAITLALTTTYMLAEIIGGLITNSLALLADAGHMLSDAASLALALFAIWIGQRPPTKAASFGFYRAEILAALANGATLVAISIYIFYEAYKRLTAPPEVQGGVMLAVATGGLVINLVGLFVLRRGKSESLNVRGAWLHVMTDMLGSLGAIVSGGLIWAFGWNWADPAASIFIGLLVIYSSWSLLKETVSVLMESTPSRIDVDKVRQAMLSVDGVEGVQDLHIWTITSGMESLSVHAAIKKGSDPNVILKDLRSLLRNGFQIDHTTIQIEVGGFIEQAPHR